LKKKKLCNTLGIEVDEGVFYEQPAGEARKKQNIFDYLMKLLLIYGGCVGEMLCLGSSFDLLYDSAIIMPVLALTSICFLVMASVPKKNRKFFGVPVLILILVLLYVQWDFFVKSAGYGYSMIAEDFNSYYGLTLPLFAQKGAVTAMGTLAMLTMLLPVCALLAASAGSASRIRYAVIAFLPYMILMLSSGHMPDAFPMSLVLGSFLGLMSMGKIAFCGRFSLPVHTDHASQSGLRGMAVLCMILFMAVSGYLGYGLFYPKVENVLGPVRYAVYNSSFRELYDQIRGGYSAGGINGGQLNRNGKLKFNHSIHLIVSADQDVNQYTYLKGYVGDVYTGDAWEPLSPALYQTLYETSGADSGELMSLPFQILTSLKNQELYGEMLPSFDGVQLMVNLPDETVGDSSYVCVPYGGLVSSADGVLADLNYITRSDSTALENVYDTYYCITANGWTGSGLSELMESLDDVDAFAKLYPEFFEHDRALEASLEAEQVYRDFVYANDLQVPDSVSNLRAEYSGKTFENLSEAIAFVQEEVARDATYTLEPGSCPYGEDFIEYFMYENKEGYCTYFASAAVMIFRCLGIPARFAQGYIIPPLSADKKVNVDDSYAHAWAEIYVDGFGWLPVEVTPGFGGRAGGFTPEMNQGENASNAVAASTSAAETEESTERLTLPQHTTEDEAVTSESETDIPEDSSYEMTGEPSDTNTEDSSEKENVTKTNPSKENSHGTQGTGVDGEAAVSDEGQEPEKTGISQQALRIIRNMVISMILLVLAGFLLYTHHRSGCAVRQRRFNQRSNRNGCLAIYRELCRMSARYYVPVDDHVPPHELSLLFPTVEEETWEQVQKIAKEAAFSSHDITDEKKQLLLAVYRKCCRYVDGKLRFVKRLLFHIWDGYR
jgi:transglutaminase-like putative cysteine protease